MMEKVGSDRWEGGRVGVIGGREREGKRKGEREGKRKGEREEGGREG